MLFDSHCHPYITFKKSSENILENFFSEDSQNTCISIGCDRETSQKSIELAKKYDGKVFASIGIHPCDIPYTNKEIEKNISELRDLYQNNKKYIVALGEIGLDYYHLASIAEKTGLSEEHIKLIQAEYFKAQIQLAQELKLPFVIHSRESNEEVLEILKQKHAKNYVFHCYSGDWELAQQILAQNPQAMFGFGGPLTFKKSLALQEVASKLPLEHILIETDAPFLTPEPFRGREENEPYFVSYVLKKLQELREENAEDIEKGLYENTLRFFNV